MVSSRVVVTGRGNLEDFRLQDVVVTDPGRMQGIEERSLGSAEKHYIWNRRCRNVPLMFLCPPLQYNTLEYNTLEYSLLTLSFLPNRC